MDKLVFKSSYLFFRSFKLSLMKKSFFLYLFILTGITSTMLAQNPLMQPYISANINGFGSRNEYNEVIDIGFGLEAGLKYNYLYIGFEYGIYGIRIYNFHRSSAS